jgi:phytoene dehydrogenase-like protein
MSQQVVIIGSGMGGLTSAIRLAQAGRRVTVLEARDTPGGLASSIEYEGFRFDSGPYVLLDRPGLEWAFRSLGLTMQDLLELQPISDMYQVTTGSGAPVHIYSSVNRTADQLERQWPGCGRRYRSFIDRMWRSYSRLQPIQWMSRPDLPAICRSGAWREIPFILRSLRSVLSAAQLPAEVVQALGIWTHVAGQSAANAPSPLAMVPAVIHSIGAFYPSGGIGAIPTALYQAALDVGVTFNFATRVKQIHCKDRRVVGVETEAADYFAAETVISNVGIGTYLRLLDDGGREAIPAKVYRRLTNLPLQSPGVCVYMAVKGKSPPPYLRFQLHDEPDGCRLMITPSVVDSGLTRDGWTPVRLMAPMHHDRAERSGEAGQQAFLNRVLAEKWWREPFEEVRILQTRLPLQWGSAFHLFRQSMNPVMTGQFMRAGRLAHRSLWIRRLYLTGSATHPGQWVSFCAVSGVLTANEVLKDLGS